MIWLILLISQAMADENWFCTSESSKIQNDQIYACGVGSAPQEEEARAKALENAKIEFSQIQNKYKKYLIEPKRTTCQESASGWKCYRLLVYSPRENIEHKDLFISNTFDAFLAKKDNK